MLWRGIPERATTENTGSKRSERRTVTPETANLLYRELRRQS